MQLYVRAALRFQLSINALPLSSRQALIFCFFFISLRQPPTPGTERIPAHVCCHVSCEYLNLICFLFVIFTMGLEFQINYFYLFIIYLISESSNSAHLSFTIYCRRETILTAETTPLIFRAISRKTGSFNCLDKPN